jgi:hypothetical protein
MTTDHEYDGFSDAASDYENNLIRGDVIKFAKGIWQYATSGSALARDIKLVATGTREQWIRWGKGEDGKPAQVDNVVRQPGAPPIEQEDLPDPHDADGAQERLARAGVR